MSRDAGEPRSWFERFVFRFMGPPQVGDHSAPVRASLPSRPCATCGQPIEAHEVVREARLTYTRCPAPQEQRSRS